ncbi:hypothetical protein BJ875DRAFT_511349 [Amylocarpus encephaloides]|uniref:Uncharacterized protein n=1 Tax=Amylocarpus encephaloides TaxID=45428 RepID=A0A9P8C521_9HELO|nr:hypothetical protein BJ875DRAFT_511349 [Amylocarpus encephaloides]
MIPKEIPCIVIDGDADLELRLYVYSEGQHFPTAGNSGNLTQGKLTARMLVCREIVTEGNPHLEKFLGGFFTLTNQNETVEVAEYNLTGLEVCLRALHGTCVHSSFELTIDELWDVIEAGLRYLVDITLLKDWMSCWYHKCKDDLVETEDLEKLVIPFRRVEFAEGLMEVTRRLAYEKSVKIRLHNPKMRRGELRYEARLEDGINAARADLGHKLSDYIEETVKQIIDSKCKCRALVLLHFFDALGKTGMFPLHKRLHGKNGISIKDAIKSLQFFKYEKPPNACPSCSRNFDSLFHQNLNNVLKNFKGICLDCVMEPLDLNGVTDQERFWDLGCEMRHDQPSWYFSWLASELGDGKVFREAAKHTTQGQREWKSRHGRPHISGKRRSQKRWVERSYGIPPSPPDLSAGFTQTHEDAHKSKSSFAEPFYLEKLLQPDSPPEILDELSTTSKPIAEHGTEWTQNSWPPVVNIPYVASPRAWETPVPARPLPRDFHAVAWSKTPASMLFYQKHRLHIVVSLPPAERLKATDLEDAYKREGMSLLTRLLGISFG